MSTVLKNGYLVGSFPRKQITIPSPMLHPADEVKSKQRSQCRIRPMTQKTQIPLSFLSSAPFFPPSSTSSSLASEISFLSNTNFKRRLSSSGSQINFTPHCNMKTSAYAYTLTHAHRHQHTSDTTEKTWQCSALIKHTPVSN